MAITQTTLSADLSATALTMTVASGTGFPTTGTGPQQNFVVRIDKEIFYAVEQPIAGTIKLRSRGSDGTVAAVHDILSKVEVGLPSDFAGPSGGNSVTLPPYIPAMQTLGEDRTFTTTEVAAWGVQPQNFAITKGSALAGVLVAPSTAQDGLVVTFTSLTAFRHVITATSLLANGATGAPYTTATGNDTKIGATLVLQAQNGLWNVVSQGGFTLT